MKIFGSKNINTVSNKVNNLIVHLKFFVCFVELGFNEKHFHLLVLVYLSYTNYA